LFIDKGREYRNYWFETGSPSFLIELLPRRATFLPDLEGIEASEEILDSFDIERIDPITLLFQTGYLTIDSTRWHRSRLRYRLRLPNQEVRMALADHLIDGYLGTLPGGRDALQDGLYDALSQGDLPGLIAAIKRLFAGVAWRNFIHQDLPETEGYYASVLYAFFASLNAEVIPEDTSNRGQVDLTVKLAGFIYCIEIKVDAATPPPAPRRENPALAQIQARGYSAKYRGLPSKGLIELGLIFDRRARNLVRADWAQRVLRDALLQPIGWDEERIQMSPPFPKVSCDLIRTAPFHRHDGALDITMLERIVMHRVDMRPSIQIIPDQMLPKSPLPDAPLAFVASAFANPLAAG
jgi:hypothetical protein